MRKNSFKDFYDAYAKPQKRQSETSKNIRDHDTKDNSTTETELKTTNDDAQEILSMIEWSQV